MYYRKVLYKKNLQNTNKYIQGVMLSGNRELDYWLQGQKLEIDLIQNHPWITSCKLVLINKIFEIINIWMVFKVSKAEKSWDQDF